MIIYWNWLRGKVAPLDHVGKGAGTLLEIEGQCIGKCVYITLKPMSW